MCSINLIFECSNVFNLASFKNLSNKASDQQGGMGRQASHPGETTKKLQLNLKTNNRTGRKSNHIWKSDNQGFKKSTFIQMGRGSRDTETGQRGEDRWCGEEMWWQQQNRHRLSHTHMW